MNGAFAVRALTGIGTLINKILSLMEGAAFSKRALTGRRTLNRIITDSNSSQKSNLIQPFSTLGGIKVKLK